jgi:protein-tyrosine phosphatase
LTVTGGPGTPRTLAGAFNFRDLGGLVTADGRRTRCGRLFRSDTLQALTSADTAYLTESLGVTTVLDLRASTEAVEQGRGPLGGLPVCYLNVPLEDAPRTAGEAGPPDRPDPAAGQPAGLVPGPTLAFYLRHLESPAPALPLALQLLAVSLDHPVVVHCAAGKDRTGLVIALALDLAGVPAAAIAEDYMVTAQNMARINARFRGWPRYREHMAAADPEFYRVEEHTIRAFLAGLRRRHGGARGWARSRGIPDEVIRLLTSRLIES